MDQDPTKRAKLVAATNIDAIALDRVQYENTENPLFVWQALFAWAVMNRALASANEPQVPLPDWIGGYLGLAAAKMFALIGGFDDRVTVKGGTPRVGRMTARERINRVPSALGLVSTGKNAFKRLDALMDQQIDLASLEFLDEEMGNKGVSPIKQMMENYRKTAENKGTEPKVVDESSLRRRVGKARRSLQAKPRG